MKQNIPLWLSPDDAGVPVDSRYYPRELTITFNTLELLNLTSNKSKIIGAIYVRVDLGNCRYPYVYVLKGSKRYFMEIYGLEHK